MMGRIAMLRRTVCWQKVDLPEPGGPTSKSKFSEGTSCSWVKDTNDNPVICKDVLVYLCVIADKDNAVKKTN